MHLARLQAALAEHAEFGPFALTVPRIGVVVAARCAPRADARAMCRHLRALGWKAYLAEMPARVVVLGERPAAGHWIMPRKQIENFRASIAFLRLARGSRRQIREAERQLAELEEQGRRGELKPLYDDRPPLP